MLALNEAIVISKNDVKTFEEVCMYNSGGGK